MEQVLFTRKHRATQKAGLNFDVTAGFPAWNGKNAPGFLRRRSGPAPAPCASSPPPPGPQQPAQPRPAVRPPPRHGRRRVVCRARRRDFAGWGEARVRRGRPPSQRLQRVRLALTLAAQSCIDGFLLLSG